MEEINPYDAPQSSAARDTSNLRGCGVGCLVAVLSYLGMAVLVGLSIPLIFHGPEWNHRALGALAGKFIFFLVAIPAGIVGFLRGRKRRRPI